MISCLLPFTHLEIAQNGDLLCCCWGKYGYLGSLRGKTISKAWNNKEFQSLRKKIYNNDLNTVCDAKTCHFIIGKKKWDEEKLKKEKLPLSLISDIKKQKTKLSSGPFKITLSDSSVCNLNCKMCFRYFVNDDRKFSKDLVFKKIPQFLDENPQRRLTIKLTGNGDPFVRTETKELLQKFNNKKYPNVDFEILTNGLLLTPKIWESIKHNKISEINVSVDGATKKTYEKIRIGGNWDILIKNLKFIGNLRKKKKIKYFYINFVVMRSNWQEMKKFVMLGRHLGCDEVNFQRIVGIHNLEENINDFPDPKIIKEISETLKDPIFKNKKNFIVNKLQLEDYSKYKPRAFECFFSNAKIILYKIKKQIIN